MVINFRFANASELEQTLGRGNRSPHLNQPVQSHIFRDANIKAELLDMKTADLAHLKKEALNALANDLNGLISVTLPTFEGIKAANLSIGHTQQFADATAKVAEFFGNNDFLAFQYATWGLLETSATMELEKGINGNARQVFDNYNRTFNIGLDKLEESIICRFPFNSLKWSQANSALADRILLCIQEYTKKLGPIKMSLILLLRAIACIYPHFKHPENCGLKELALVSHSYAKSIHPEK